MSGIVLCDEYYENPIFSEDEEKAYTRGNYQILQDLDLEYSDFKKLSDTTMNYFEQIMDGDMSYMLAFSSFSIGHSIHMMSPPPML